jgi:plasmid stability protein
MPAVVIRNISAETHRTLKQRAREKGISTEAEMRSLLDGAAAPPKPSLSLADVLYDPAAAESALDLPPRKPWKPRELNLG